MFPDRYCVKREEDQYVYEFPNGYEAWVMRNGLSLGGINGLWEVRLQYRGELVHDLHGLPFIFGFNTTKEALELLEKIRNIPMKWVPSQKKTLLRLIDYFGRS